MAELKEKGPKDDGSRWRVVEAASEWPVYLPTTEGLTRAEAERLAAGLVMPTKIVCVREATA